MRKFSEGFPTQIRDFRLKIIFLVKIEYCKMQSLLPQNSMHFSLGPHSKPTPSISHLYNLLYLEFSTTSLHMHFAFP